jgi:hypothetical protein
MTKLVVVHPGLYTSANEALTGSFAPDVNAIRYSQGMTKEDILSAVEGVLWGRMEVLPPISVYVTPLYMLHLED